MSFLIASALIDSAAITNMMVSTRRRWKRSASQPPPIAPKIAPKLSTSRKLRLEPSS